MDDEHRKLIEALDRKIGAGFAGLNNRLDAVVSRLDEQDAAHDRLTGKVDRLAVLARAGEDAVTSIDALSRRVAKLEAAQRGGNE